MERTYKSKLEPKSNLREILPVKGELGDWSFTLERYPASTKIFGGLGSF